MPDHSHTFGGGASASVLSPIVLIVLLAAVVLIWALPRRYIVVPFLFAIFLTPGGQQLYIGGVHWFAARLLILAGLIRLAVLRSKLRSSIFAKGLNSADKAFLYCMLCEAVCVSVRYAQVQAVINQVGFLIDSVGAYVILRCLIRSRNDIYTVIKCLAILGLILGLCMIREQLLLHNIFGELGGVQLVPDVREGKIRSQAVFQHALTAGTFAASLVPLFALLWRCGRGRVIAAIGFVGCTIMTITSQSSTPLLAYVAGVFAICMWPLRRRMKEIRIGLVFAVLGLAMIMKAPVWFVIAHIDLTGGSSGYHRAELIDQFVRHFPDWWLLGASNPDNWGFDMWDTQNEFVNIGETGGLLALILFIAMITRCFSRLGKARKRAAGRGIDGWFAWLLGAALFAHIVGFFGVNYFDQSKIGWFALLAMIAVTPITNPALSKKTVRVTERHPLVAAGA